MAAEAKHVLFVHGLWMHSTTWGAWTDLFREQGFESSAPGWPGDSDTVEETRKNADRVADHGLDEIVAHHAEATGGLKPIVIGHSFGGLIAERLLAEGHASAAVAIDAAPMKGILYLPPSALRVASVALRNPANRKRAVSLTKEQFRYGFGNAVPSAESDGLYERWAIPSPGRPLFEAAFATFVPNSPAKVATDQADRGPLLLTAGGKDHTVPAAVTKQAVKRYRKSQAVTELKEFPDRGHSLCIDHGWREVAESVLDWLRRQNL